MRRILLATVLSISLTAALSAQAQTFVYMVPQGQTMEQTIKNAENDWDYCNKARFDAGITKLASGYFMQQCVQMRIANNDHSAPPAWKERLVDAAGICGKQTEQFPALQGNSAYAKYLAMGSIGSCLQSELAH
jgi:hypothetical protein